MKLPSLSHLYNQAILAFRKHPLVILAACTAVFFAIFLVEQEDSVENAFPFINLLLCGYLGVALFLAIDVFSKASNQSGSFRVVAWSVGVLLLVGVYFYLPGSEDTLNKQIPYIRYSILAIAAHLLVSFAPFLSRGTLNGFWQFNRVIFLRFLLAVLYSGFLYVGLVLALVALDELFKVDVDEKRYFEIFIFISGVFNTWFFAAGIPDKYDELDLNVDFPKGLRTFILYVLIPLLGLYFLILYSYSIKIIFAWDWPSGIITYMVIAVAVLGTLAMLLSYPYSLRENKSPLAFLNKGYFWVLIPMIIMLYLAIGIRVADYGITINRYIAILLAFWLSGISIYMVVSGKDIRLIPISLFSVILLCSFGPWGLFDASERSQVARLEMLLTNAGILEGKIKDEPEWNKTDTVRLSFNNPNTNDHILSDSLHNEVVSIVRYLEDFHGLNAIEGWFTQSTREIAQAHNLSENAIAMRLMGLRAGRKHTGGYESFPTFYASGSQTSLLQIDGFEYYYELSLHQKNEPIDSLELSDGLELVLSLEPGVLMLARKETDSLLKFDLNKVYDDFMDMNNAGYYRSSMRPNESIILAEENEWLKARLYIERFRSKEEGITECGGKLLFTFTDK
ncbi:MAG: DUF4153 domain-containing protein [Cyclobacteriaceae bacterium]